MKTPAWEGRPALLLVLAGLFLCLVACGGQPVRPTRAATAAPPAATATPSPVAATAAATATATPAPTATATMRPWLIAAADGVPQEIAAAAGELVERLPADFGLATEETADVTVQVGAGAPLAHWIYALAAPFATVADGLALAELGAIWRAGEGAYGRLLLDHESALALAAQWGQPGPAARLVEAAALGDALWEERPALSLLPFHRLSPRLKVLRLDGLSPLDPDFDPAAYPLTLPIGLAGDPAAVAALLSAYAGPATNRDPARLTRLAMTGPSGLGRAVGDRIERYGVTYPGEGVAAVLRAADIAHMSNEVPFAPDCPHPEPVGGTTFCAQDEYLPLLTSMGIDVNEMTGNHVNDWGPRNLLHTFDLYQQAGILTFGGGRNLDLARQPLLIERQGNRLAFVGCNSEGPYYAWAREEYPGAAPCGDYSFIRQQISELAGQGFLVIATLQYLEHYQYDPTGFQRRDFGALAEAGATAVSGSQGHHAQGFDFVGDRFVHYGLGNLIFDQMQFLGTRQSFIDLYAFYDGRLLSVELFTGLIEDYARPRPMTAEERAALLQAVFAASGW